MRISLILWLAALLLLLTACRRGADEAATATALALTPPATAALPTAAVPTIDLVAAAATATAQALATQLTPSPLPQPTNAPALPTAAPPASGVLGSHQVRAGETLYCIGRTYGVRPQAIAQTNNLLLDGVLSVGQTVRIPAVRWENIPPGTTCAPQFQSPYTAAPQPTAPPPPTPVADSRGPEVIYIGQPGLASRLVSPIRIAGEAEGAFEQSLVVNLVVDGQVVAASTAQIAADMGQRGPFSIDLPFSLPPGAAAETPAHILVYSISPRDGGVTHLSSVLVYLVSAGASAINPGGSGREFFTMDSPAHLATLTGGTALVTGYSDPVFESTLGLVVCGEGGSGAPHLLCGTEDNVLGTGLAMVQSPDIGQPGPFATDVTYTVTAPTGGTIVLFVTSPMDGTVTHVFSRPVMLAP